MASSHTMVFFTAFLPLAAGTLISVEVELHISNYTFQQLIPPAGFNISTLSRLNFSARICNDVIVLLTKYQQERPQYEIVIGGWRNTQSAIRQRKEKTTLLTHQHSPLSCHEFRKFFISWKGAVLKVGSVREDASHPGGTVEEVFLQHTDPSPFPVRFAFVAGWSVAGVVKFYFTDVRADTTTESSAGQEATTIPLTTPTTTTFTTPTTAMGVSTDITSTSPLSTDVSEEVTAFDDVTKTTGSLDSTDRPTSQNPPPPRPCRRCYCRLLKNESGLEPQDPEEVASKLLIPTNTTSAARRRRTSATDPRPSSTAFGAVGIVFLSLPVLLMVCSDLINVRRWMESRKEENAGSNLRNK